jgi:hypothetical protein
LALGGSGAAAEAPLSARVDARIKRDVHTPGIPFKGMLMRPSAESIDIQLTEREVAIAKAAAKLAVAEISDEFYKQVGKTVVTKVLVWIGIAFVAFAAGKGWLASVLK